MFTQLAEGWLELLLMEGKITVYMNVTQKRSTRIDISSGELSSVFRMTLEKLLVAWLIFQKASGDK